MIKLIRYVYWCCAHINYKHFGENGETGKIILSFITFFGIFDVLMFFRVLLFEHTDFVILFGNFFKDVFKIVGLILAFVIYYLINKNFKNYPVMNNNEFSNVSKRKRLLHTTCIFVFLMLELYILLIILSPTFYPRQLIY
ncbi:hypothetical protein [Flavobacterium proteolyticum]|uniref:Uncharacterized protein n=1 Tax=Flavobacterium proteolyticum TaxID=2911683 RepID=A0ABR9WNZ6_9FLAO|nr:hypothetical protein [Flavobacterium proteolyticum]MBE9575627.1 hypothetical protein [Flavobacterium proteolyticum]